MFKNYIKIAYRNMNKFKVYSLINILGLALGLSTFILIALYVQFELSYDKYHENVDDIYRIVRTEDYTATPASLAPTLMEEFPEIISATRIIKSNNMLISYGEKNIIEDELYWADPKTFEIFSIPFISGDSKTALSDPNSILLSERTANKYFGNENPIGKVLILSDKDEYKVTGVFYNMPNNSHFIMDVILPYVKYFHITGNKINNWSSNFSYTYCLLREGVDPKVLEEKFSSAVIPHVMKSLNIQIKKPYPKVYLTQPLSDIHLYSQRKQEINVNNNINNIIIISTIGILILLIACINYMNLATARSMKRSKEVGMRKIIGARRTQLITQFIGESIVITMFAMIVSILIISFVLPYFNNLVERELEFNVFSNPSISFVLLILVIIIGMLAGSYPALKFSNFSLKNNLNSGLARNSRGTTLRNLLVLTQFAITIILISFTLIVNDQLDFIKNKDVGYNKEQIVVFEVGNKNIGSSIHTIKSELLSNSDVLSVSTSANLPNDIATFTRPKWLPQISDAPVPVYYSSIGYDFLDAYKIEILNGRSFSEDFPSDENGAFIVNEMTVKAAKWENPIGQEITHWNGKKGKVVGVMKDFHLHSLHSPIEPLYFLLDAKSFSYISIKISSNNIPKSINYIKEVLKRHAPNYPLQYAFFDELFEEAYFSEQRLSTIFKLFGILGIFLASLGLLGLSSFSAEQRRKEIGIRKVLGANMGTIILLLSKEFLKWVLLANIIAWPLAYFGMQSWLNDFEYRVEISYWTFVFPTIGAFIIALTTVSYQSIKAALANPLDSLRSE